MMLQELTEGVTFVTNTQKDVAQDAENFNEKETGTWPPPACDSLKCEVLSKYSNVQKPHYYYYY